MTIDGVACPSRQALADFGFGRLDGGVIEVIGAHLETCANCRRIVAGLSADSLADSLRSPPQRTANTDESVSVGRGETPADTVPRAGVVDSACPAAPEELANHPNYEIVKELGRGGMGVVYLARNRMMDRLEVLKVVNRALLDRPGAFERFQQEIRAAARLRHPNIVAAYSALRLRDLLVLAMEYIGGEDLSKLVKRRGPLPIVNATFYIQQAALGLQHAHEKGMVHRDIKPSNLILAQDDKRHVVKILDFGLAKATSEKSDDRGLTKSGQLLGTPDYIAPEQALDAQMADIRADIYSLGCTLYYLLVGRPPFEGEGLYEVLHAHQSAEALSLRLARPEAPSELAAVVAKMMAKPPEQRYQTPREVAKALVPFFKTGAATKASASGDAPSSVTPPPLPASVPVVAPVYAPLASGSNVATAAPSCAGSIRAEQTARPNASGGVNRRRIIAFMAIGLFVGFSGILGAVVSKYRTAEGMVVIEVNVKNPEVIIDGDKATVTWNDGGARAEIALQPGSRRIELKKDGFKTLGETVELSCGERVILAANLERLNPVTVPARAATGGHELKSQTSSAVAGVNPEPGAPQPTVAATHGSAAPAVAPDRDYRWPSDSPAPATAPFDAEQAKTHQAAWAGHLKVPVERTNSLDMKLALIPPGEFMMGSSEEDVERIQRLIQTTHGRNAMVHSASTETETPRHLVRITRPFWLASHETTVANFTAFADETHYLTGAERTGRGGQVSGPNGWIQDARYSWRNTGMPRGDRFPVTQLSWQDAVDFCRWLSQKERARYRLPTEAEWEYCCRAGTTTDWFSGNDPRILDQVAWHGGNSAGQIKPVRTKSPNAFGLYDMHGNAWEWLQDQFGAYGSEPIADPIGNAISTDRVMRGGAAILQADLTRSAWRWGCDPENCDYVTGFRVVCEIDRPPSESGQESRESGAD